MLAIGIVVDDAIVVVEAVEHHIEHGLAPREATITAMEQVSAPVIAVGLVLTAVFVPVCVHHGHHRPVLPPVRLDDRDLDGDLGVQLADPSPALSALLLRPRQKGVFQALPWPAFVAAGRLGGLCVAGPAAAHARGAAADLHSQSAWISVELAANLAGLALGGGRLAAWSAACLNCALGLDASTLFNQAFDAATSVYTRMVGGLLRVSVLVLVLYGGLLGLTYWSFTRTPTGFIPPQDKGYLLVNVQLARLVVAGADPAGDEAGRGRSPASSRASRTPWRSPASRSC